MRAAAYSPARERGVKRRQPRSKAIEDSGIAFAGVADVARIRGLNCCDAGIYTQQRLNLRFGSNTHEEVGATDARTCVRACGITHVAVNNSRLAWRGAGISYQLSVVSYYAVTASLS
jgi:hypothetical protein